MFLHNVKDKFSLAAVTQMPLNSSFAFHYAEFKGSEYRNISIYFKINPILQDLENICRVILYDVSFRIFLPWTQK